MLQKPVSPTQVPDYNLYVAKEDEMSFEIIERKLKEAQYSTATEFMTDIDRIVSNAVAYNSQYCGDQGHQGNDREARDCSIQYLGSVSSLFLIEPRVRPAIATTSGVALSGRLHSPRACQQRTILVATQV